MRGFRNRRAAAGALCSSLWNGRFLWKVIWPWLFYELILAFVYVLYGWFLGEMGSLLIAMLGASLILMPVYRLENKLSQRQNVNGLSSGYGSLVLSDKAGNPQRKRQASAVFFFHVKLALTAACACLFLNLLLYMLVMFQLPHADERVNELLFSVPLWFQLLLTGLAAPFTEELIYRGLVYERLRSAFSVFPAAVCSALFFGVTHGNLIQGLYAAALGMLLALVYETGGLSSAVWFHAWANLTSIAMNRLLLNQTILQEALTEGDFRLVMLWLAVSGAGLVSGMAKLGNLFPFYGKRQKGDWR